MNRDDNSTKENAVTDRSNQPPNPCSQWLSQESWDNITQLERLPRFLSITVSFDENSRLWEDWYLTLEPEKRPLPGFHMLLLIRCLRLDRLTSCMGQLISDTIVNRDSTPNKPLVLFTASRDTVSSMLLKLYLEEYKDTPWAALKSLIAETIYGGHIADKNDERLMMTYYDQYFVMNLSTVSEYSVPEDGSLETYVNFIAELPIAEAPEVFGQHSKCRGASFD
ncbi:dynein heavy chain 2, axonemal [Caerostris extrusa]|uniref:Dynein heavy chain 2, axonemal n=1 Tax=Caerostris extrusa TaxID=172846 RepID=A0AAV4R784_CAEEX|nr:dynein heavy chain 2, axonemal [Caerostris extrusa]